MGVDRQLCGHLHCAVVDPARLEIRDPQICAAHLAGLVIPDEAIERPGAPIFVLHDETLDVQNFQVLREPLPVFKVPLELLRHEGDRQSVVVSLGQGMQRRPLLRLVARPGRRLGLREDLVRGLLALLALLGVAQGGQGEAQAALLHEARRDLALRPPIERVVIL